MLYIKTTDVALGAAMPYKSSMINWETLGAYYVNYAHWQGILNDPIIQSKFLVLTGIEKSGSGTFSISAGTILAQGSTIFVAAASGLTPGVGQTIVGTISDDFTFSTSLSYDPVTFSDGTTHNVHVNQVITWSVGTSGINGDFDYDDLIFLHEQWQSPTYLTGWSDDSWNSNGGLKYKRDMIGNALVFKGSCQSTNAGGTTYPIFTLPAAYRPSNSKTMPIMINEDGGTTIVIAFLVINASTGNVFILSFTASTTIDIASFDGIRIPLD